MARDHAEAAGRDDGRGSVPLLDFLTDAIAGAASDQSLTAIGREAVKDIRETIMETFFGDPERGGEMGTPLNPTPSEIANADVHTIPSPLARGGQEAAGHAQTAHGPSPSQMADNADGQEPADPWNYQKPMRPQEEGPHTQKEKQPRPTWREEIENENRDGDGGRGRGRSPSEAAPQQERGRDDFGRGGRC